ncbi:MBL fold metallo-hydrolase [Natranaerobius thermophilus]|uniref:Beta-lactamase domain protein n=1 Tax=Natranaerobius thermophilus (strain ATCC BAA-1301 / DSM 18059 / JW/NM-WN-LF) TaxID=457570 RepID=B2A495_NATTJ|nr:MBL fold metallo-hydrolase [Natranaerobius thermophilus]ACB83749.1 beta-lactamase domain protein [Natranaerobius thermophilus JW/NM-WN-LF]
MKVTFLGTGPSHGVPVIGCSCSVCSSKDSKNTRYRSSVIIKYENNHLLIDTPPEFRLQMINNNIHRIDGVLFTHPHADHVHGFDDLRRFNEIQRESIPCFASSETVKNLKNMYSYVFRGGDPYTSSPKVTLHSISSSFELNGLTINPIPIYHGKSLILGYRIGRFAYLTDCSQIPPDSYKFLQGLHTLVIGALRYRSHPNHLSVDEAVETVNKINPEVAYFTHMTHDLDYYQLNEQLPVNIKPAFDNLTIQVE